MVQVKYLGQGHQDIKWQLNKNGKQIIILISTHLKCTVHHIHSESL